MNAKEIKDFAEAQRTRYSFQREEDMGAQQRVHQRHILDLQKPPGQRAQQPDTTARSSPVGSGYGPWMFKQRFAYFSSTPFRKVNAPTPNMRGKADRAEVVLQHCDRFAQGAVDVWRRKTRDAVWSGRGWSSVLPVFDAWSGPKFDRRTDESDDNFLERLKRLRLGHLPLVHRAVDVRDTWPTFGPTGEIEQVIEIRRMVAPEVRRAYGPDLLLGDWSDKEMVTLYIYADDERQVTVADDKGNSYSASGQSTGEPRVAHEFEHGLGMNPYTLISLEPVPAPNDDGLFWAGVTYDARHAIPAIDSIASDLLFSFRKGAHGPYVAKLSREARGQFSIEELKQQLVVSPDGVIPLWGGADHEEFGPVSPPILNTDGLRILEFLTTTTLDRDIRKALQGEAMAGTSGTLYNTLIRTIEKEQGPTLDNFKRGAERIGWLYLRGLMAFMEKSDGVGKGEPTTVPIFGVAANGKKYSFDLKRGDIEGWEPFIQARLEPGYQMNENAQVEVARLLTEPGRRLAPRSLVMATKLGIENTEEAEKEMWGDEIFALLVANSAQLVANQGLHLMTQPQGGPAETAQRFGALNPQIQQGIQMHAAGVGQPSPEGGKLARGAANRVRGPQNLSQTAAQEIGGSELA